MADSTKAPGSYTGTGGRQRCLYISILLGLACVFNIHNFGKYMVDLSVTSRTIDWTMEPRHEPTNLNDDRNNTSKGILRAPDFLAAEQQIDRTARYTVGNDWYNKERFDAQFEEQCLVVDNICLSSGRWWYKPLEEGVDGYQPPFILHARLDGAVGYPEMINVTSIHDLDVAQQTSNAQCAVSPIIDHIIMYSYYNTMLGEFYARILKGLFEISRTADDYMDFLQQTQVYVHMYNKNDKTMLESHHIFTDAFRGHPLLDLKVLLHTAGCRCLQRLFLCGYNIDPPNRKAQKKLSSSNKGISLTPGEGISAKNQEAFAEVRKVLLKRVIDENPFMQADIQAYREKALRSKNIEGNFNDWKVIGLSQRSGRRRWIGLTEIEQKCDLVLRSHKIICVEVNVESAEFHPYNHAVVHGGLDALFGIHGAQITEAMWMKPGSLAVEFLPWVHEDLIMGTWTRSVRTISDIGRGDFFVRRKSNFSLFHIGERADAGWGHVY